MSVTTPILRLACATADADAASEAEAAADGEVAAEGAVEGGAAVDGVGVAPLVQAPTMMARPPNSDRPSERLCMCPPPGSRSARPRTSDGPTRSRSTFAPRSDHRRILTTVGRPGKYGRESRAHGPNTPHRGDASGGKDRLRREPVHTGPPWRRQC